MKTNKKYTFANDSTYEAELISELILGKHIVCKTLFSQYIKTADSSEIFIPLKETTDFLKWMEEKGEKKYHGEQSWERAKYAVEAFMACSERMYQLHRAGKNELARELLDSLYEDLSRELQSSLSNFYKDIIVSV